MDLLVIDWTAMKHLQLADSVEVLSAANLSIQVILIPRGERWVDCFLGGPVDGSVSAGRNCVIHWYRDDLKEHPVTVTLEIELKNASAFILGVNQEVYSFDLPAGKDTYRIPVSVPTDEIYFRAPDSDMTVFSFRVDPD